MSKAFLPYGRQSINEQDIQALAQAAREEIITRGKHVEAFEAALAKYCEAKYAVAFNNGTSALQACYFAAETTSNDYVLTTPNSFFATCGASLVHKASIVFVDIDRKTGNLDLDALEPNMNKTQTRGKEIIVPVHFAGIPVDIEKIDSMIRRTDTVIIEDAAHAIGSKYKDGTPVGCCRYSQMTMFSFHPVKNITTGEGGAVTTNDPEIYHRLRLFRNNGIERDPQKMEQFPGPWHYEVQVATGNYNFTDLQAALGLSQLGRLETFVEKRRTLVGVYRKLLKDFGGIQLLDANYDSHTAYHILVAQIDFSRFGKHRTEVMEKLMQKGIGTQVHYIPIYRHPAMHKVVGDISEFFPNTEGYFASALTLPLFYEMETSDVEHVVTSLKKILKT